MDIAQPGRVEQLLEKWSYLSITANTVILLCSYKMYIERQYMYIYLHLQNIYLPCLDFPILYRCVRSG